MSGTVYFVECAGRIKIGHSNDALRRIRSLGTGAPAALNVLAIVPGSRNFEQAIHKRLAQWRVRMEWFEDRASVRSLMDRIVAEGYEAIGFVEPERTPADDVADADHAIDVRKQEQLQFNEDQWSLLTGRLNALTDLIGRLMLARRLEMLSGAAFGSLVGLIAEGAFSKVTLKQGTDLVDKAIKHLALLSDQANVFNEDSNEFVLAQAEGIVTVAERSFETLFRFRDIWGTKGENRCTETRPLTGPISTSKR